MAFEVFQDRVTALVRKANIGVPEEKHVKVQFRHDEESGTHYANCSDGTTIIGNSISARMAVKFGSGHMAFA